jgi:hypothetical protein
MESAEMPAWRESPPGWLLRMDTRLERLLRNMDFFTTAFCHTLVTRTCRVVVVYYSYAYKRYVWL